MGMAKRKTFTDEVKEAIEGSGLRHCDICREIGLDQAVMCRFMQGRSGLALPTLDKLAALLDLHVNVGPKGQKAKGRG